MKTILNTTATLFLVLFITSCNDNNTEADPTNESEKNLTSLMMETNEHRYEAWNTADMELMQSTMADSFNRHMNGKFEFEGKEGYNAFMKNTLTGFPDIHFDHEVIGVDGNRIFTRWTASGTNTGRFNGFPASGLISSNDGFTVTTYNDEGKVVMEDSYLDYVGVLSQLGYNIRPPKEE